MGGPWVNGQWLVAWWNICRWVGGQWSVIDGLVLLLKLGRRLVSVVDGLSVVGGFYDTSALSMFKALIM